MIRNHAYCSQLHVGPFLGADASIDGAEMCNSWQDGIFGMSALLSSSAYALSSITRARRKGPHCTASWAHFSHHGPWYKMSKRPVMLLSALHISLTDCITRFPTAHLSFVLRSLDTTVSLPIRIYIASHTPTHPAEAHLLYTSYL